MANCRDPGRPVNVQADQQAGVSDASPECTPIRTWTLSPAGHGCETSARCISIAAAAQALGEANTAKNASPCVSISLPPCAARPARISRR